MGRVGDALGSEGLISYLSFPSEYELMVSFGLDFEFSSSHKGPLGPSG